MLRYAYTILLSHTGSDKYLALSKISPVFGYFLLVTPYLNSLSRNLSYMLWECDTSATDVDLYLGATPPFRYVPGQYLNYSNRVLTNTVIHHSSPYYSNIHALRHCQFFFKFTNKYGHSPTFFRLRLHWSQKRHNSLDRLQIRK